MPNWYYIDDFGQQQGPVSDSQLKKLAIQGMIQPDTPLETDAGKKGKAGQIKGLFPAVTDSFAQTAEPPPLFNDAEVAAMQVERLSNVQQPPAAAKQPRRTSRAGVSDKSTLYLVLSIFMTLCCFPLTGIPAIIFSVLYKNDYAAGRYESAAKNANLAFWCLVSGAVIYVIICVFYLFILIAAVRVEQQQQQEAQQQQQETQRQVEERQAETQRRIQEQQQVRQQQLQQREPRNPFANIRPGAGEQQPNQATQPNPAQRSPAVQETQEREQQQQEIEPQRQQEAEERPRANEPQQDSQQRSEQIRQNIERQQLEMQQRIEQQRQEAEQRRLETQQRIEQQRQDMEQRRLERQRN